MNKKLLFLIIGALLGTAAIAYAAPTTQNFTNIQPFTTDTYDNGTSTHEWFHLFTQNASTTNLSVTSICLTGDTCRTTWPSSGGSQTPWTANESAAGFTLNDLNVLNTNTFNATSTLGTSTVANALQIGATTGNHALMITPSQNYSASGSIGGALLLNNTNNTGSGLVLYTNQSSIISGANLLSVRSDDPTIAGVVSNFSGAGNAQLVNDITCTNTTACEGQRITVAGTSGGSYNEKLVGPAPQIEWSESDQVAPFGEWETGVNNGMFYLSSRKADNTGFSGDSALAFQPWYLGGQGGTGTTTPWGTWSVQGTTTLPLGAPVFVVASSSNTVLFSVDQNGIASTTGITTSNATSTFNFPVQIKFNNNAIEPFYIGTSTTGCPIYGCVQGDIMDAELNFNGNTGINVVNDNQGTCASEGFWADGNIPTLNNNYAFFGFLNTGWTGSGCAMGNGIEKPLDAVITNPTGGLDFELASTTQVGWNFYGKNNAFLATLKNDTGNFGLGTSTPGSKFSIQGNEFIAGNITSTSTVASIFPYATSTDISTNGLQVLAGANTNIQLNNGAGESIWGTNVGLISQSSLGQISASGSGVPLVFYTGASRNTMNNSALEKMRIASTGFVGIATSTPWGFLSVMASTSGSVSPLFVVGTSTQLSTSTAFMIAASGHIIASSTNPTLSGCGTGPTIKGDDTHGEIVIGTAATSCTMQFQIFYSSAPVCTVTNQSMSITSAMTYTISTTALIISQATGFAGDKVDYMCEGLIGPN